MSINKKPYSLIKNINRDFISIFLISMIFLIIIFGFYRISSYKTDIKQFKQDYLLDTEVFLSARREEMIDYVKYIRDKMVDSTEMDLVNKINEISLLTDNLYNKYKDTYSKDKIILLIKDILREFSYFEGRGYIYCIDEQGVMVFNKNSPELEGKDINNVTDTNGKNLFLNIKEVLKNSNGGFLTYTWKSPEFKTGRYTKLTYVRKFEPLGLYFGIGEYLYKIDNEVQKNIRERLFNLNQNNKEFYFLIENNGKILTHPIPHAIGFDIRHFLSVKISNYWEKQMKEIMIHERLKGTADRIYNHHTNELTKFAYDISLVKPYNFILLIGRYMDDMTNLVDLKQKEALKNLFIDLGLYISIIFIFIFLNFYINKKISNKMKESFEHYFTVIRESIFKRKVIEDKEILITEFEPFIKSSNSLIEEIIERDDNLIENEQKYRLGQLLGKFSHWELDFKTGKIEFSPEYFALFEIDDEINDFNQYKHIIHIDDREKFNNIFNIKTKKKEGWEIEYRIYTKKGVRWINEITDCILDNDGELLRILGVIRDITTEKITREDLLEAKNKAEEMDNLKSEFLANLSHEIRTPLTSIVGYSDLILKKDVESAYSKFLYRIKNSCNDLMYIINDIVDISKINQKQIKIIETEVVLNDLITEINEYYNNFIDRKDIHFSVINQLEENLILITDRTRLMQIITNLINNAFKFTNEGEISITIKNDPNYNLNIIVKDTGIGIDKDKFNLIFEPFRQVDSSDSRSYSGLGLGLAISKKLAGFMGGTLDVYSEKNIGTTFVITLPEKIIRKQYNKQINIGKDEKKLSAIQNIPVIIAEDNRLNNEIIKISLKEHFKTIYATYNGKEVIKILENEPIKECIILMDINMPVMDGMKAMKYIKKEIDKDITIIALTANAMTGDKEKFLEAGFDGYIPKPFSEESLLRVLKKFL